MPKRIGEFKSKNIIGKKLKYLRTKNNLSQRDFARELQLRGVDMDRNVITRIENGKRYVTDIEIKIIAKYFNVSYEYLLDD